jgi:hypothetical protein
MSAAVGAGTFLSTLSHSGLLAIYEVGSLNRVHFLLSELLTERDCGRVFSKPH